MFWVVISASVASASPSNLEQFSAIVAPYTLCEIDGLAKLKPYDDQWSEATRASYKTPSDLDLKSKAEDLFKDYALKKKSVLEKCGYEKIHAVLRQKILQLHPKIDESNAFWLARSVFSSLNDLNEHIVRLERGEFPPAPVAPPPPPPPPPKPR